MGFPNEPEEVYRKYYDDLALLVHLQPPTGAFPIRFDRFSPYFVHAKEYGLSLEPKKFYEMIYPSPPFAAGDLSDLAYYFADSDYDAPYIVNTARWLGKLRERIAHWQARWHQRDRRLKPELTVKQRRAAPVVYDTRSGAVVEHSLSPSGWKILDLLEDQQRQARLLEKLENVPAPEVAAEIAILKQRGLLFEEDGIYLSLVVRSDTGLGFSPALRTETRQQAQPAAAG